MPENVKIHRFLQDILDAKQHEIKRLNDRISELKKVSPREATNNFIHRLGNPNSLNCIAEIKRKSPSKGLLRADFEVDEIAREYNRLDVAAISVLTEQNYFDGDPEYIAAVKQVASQPVLRKDFILDESQLYESCALGADAVLLIVRILSRAQLKDFLDLAHELNMAALVEIHDFDELDAALKIDARVIGINNRDLVNFNTDLSVALNLVKEIPDNVIRVCESGLHNRSGLEMMKKAGFNAVLMGEYFMRSANISQAYNAMFSDDQS